MTEKPNEIASTEDFEFAALEKAENYRAALLQEFAPHLRGDVIEIGAGIGQFTDKLNSLPAIRRLVCLEPDAGFCGKFRQLHPGQPLIQGTIDDVEAGTQWDGIVSVNVLEHIREDEGELVKYARRLSPKHGVLCLFVPARPEIYAPIDKDFGHFRRYVRRELQTKLQRAGFDLVRINYFNWIGYFAWWLNFCLLKKRRFDVGSVVAFDRFIFPVVHRSERLLCRPPFGQSLLAIARSR